MKGERKTQATVKPGAQRESGAGGKTASSEEPRPVRRRNALFALLLLLGAFLAIELSLPLRTTVQIGGDEGFELAKATLCLKGYRLYTDVWNDQPPLHTFLVTQTLKHLSGSVLGPRLITVGFALVLIASVFFMALRVGGLRVAVIAAALLIVSPGFVAISASTMLEVPAMAPAMAALCVLLAGRHTAGHVREIVAGILFAISIEIKLINLFLLPIAALVVWVRWRGTGPALKPVIRAGAILGLSLAIGFVALDFAIDGGAFLRHFQQSWVSHFGAARSFEYGSAADHPFEWRILLRNWDTTLPASLGVVFLCSRIRRRPEALVPLALLAWTLAVFAIHRPWWSYYYVHLAVPLGWCAALGIEAIWPRMKQSRVWLGAGAAAVLAAAAWMGTRVYLQMAEIRNSPQTYSSLVLTEIEQFKPFTKWMYADRQVYSFHSGVPMPPPLAVVMLKRLWSGEMTNERIAAEMQKFRPELVLLVNDTRMVPFKELLDAEYRLVYQDGECRLYALRTMIQQMPQ